MDLFPNRLIEDDEPSISRPSEAISSYGRFFAAFTIAARRFPCCAEISSEQSSPREPCRYVLRIVTKSTAQVIKSLSRTASNVVHSPARVRPQRIMA